MNLKNKIRSLEDFFEIDSAGESERKSIIRMMKCGLLPSDTNIEGLAQDLAGAGIRTDEIISEVMREIDGYDKGILPMDQCDLIS